MFPKVDDQSLVGQGVKMGDMNIVMHTHARTHARARAVKPLCIFVYYTHKHTINISWSVIFFLKSSKTISIKIIMVFINAEVYLRSTETLLSEKWSVLPLMSSGM